MWPKFHMYDMKCGGKEKLKTIYKFNMQNKHQAYMVFDLGKNVHYVFLCFITAH